MADAHRGHHGFRTAQPQSEAALPPPLRGAIAGIAAVPLRPQFELEALPPPRRLATFSHAVSVAVCDPDGDEIASGRFVVLYEPQGQDEWRGVFRCVTLAQADLEAEIAEDPLLPDVAWSWLTEALDQRAARHAVLGGTVSRSASMSFGELAERPASTSVELRASWTPAAPSGTGAGDGVGGGTGEGEWTEAQAQAAFEAHFQAWLDLIATAAGLPPLVAGVTVLPTSR
ncbi:DUF3000 domain-containing protein [Actinocrinis puniceicyclus]|uniref:DUF3000 domain-containing protein n=1 Tax=Actinocrinis puniceicyclus TaxID=977794 RepID=A0A8J7WIY9_9ACTN|nr:DUF3000 domain-containing protein [Actinocrinis puniceicyclus]MBS2963086.1 DUF3000 domain-containing protein [Actinocrinis puniceicyclus]